jgi:D-sedoheptulose 7-phosphate isomerase
MKWKVYVSDIKEQLTGLVVTDVQGHRLDTDVGYTQWVELTQTVKKNRKIVYFCGNGASASMASHMSADLAKNGRVHTEVLTEPSLVTAISNDISYEAVFSDPLSVRAKAGDMLIAISSSGSSPNVLEAVKEAKKHDLTVITISGMNAGNPLRSSGSLNFYIPANTYGYVESTHSVVLHHWMDRFELITNTEYSQYLKEADEKIKT